MIYDVIFSFLTAFTLTFFAIPSIIKIAKAKNLCDEPGERRSHKMSTPSLGGIAIFAGVIFSILLWMPYNLFGGLQYILCAFIIVFLIGAKDDIIPLTPYKKLIGQVLAASLLVFKSGIVISNLHGIFGLYQLPEWASISLSLFTILIVINAFNLIDGINGLSGSIGVLISIILGVWFFLINRADLAIISFSLTGALLAFLRYNFTPAKIFMGDTGALFTGLICSILVIEFIGLHDESFYEKYPELAFQAAPAVAVGILILPLFDTLRVFIMRVSKGRSPLHPDRSHIHHLLVDYGFSHMKATGILIAVNIFFILIAYYFQYLGSLYLILLILILAVGLSGYLKYSVSRKKLKGQGA